MENKFTTSEKVLIKLLAGVLLNHKKVEIVGEKEWEELLLRADKHQVLSLLYDVVEASDLSNEKKQEWTTKAKQIVFQNYHLLFTAKYVIELLEKSNVPCVLLKGATIAEYFPVPELRKSGDVDIMAFGEANIKKAEKLLQEAGFKKSREQHASHHILWYSPEGIELELHIKLIEQFSVKNANQKVDSLLEDLEMHIQRNRIMDVEFPVLSDGYQAYHLLLHMLVHYLHSGFGLRLLCDWVVFWNRKVAEKEREEYKRLIASSGLQKFSDVITSVCIYFFGLDNPRIGECSSQEEAECFLNEVLEAEEFGSSDSDRLIVLYGNGIRAYAREFHHQMKMNYPKLEKIWILWPILWISTLMRFVINNHKLRKTTSWRVLRKTHVRSKNIKKLQLFQMES